MNAPSWRVSNVLLGKNGRQLLIASVRMNWLGQSENDTKLWMWLVEKVKSDAVKSYCIGTWNVRSTNPGKLKVVKQMARVNIIILGISELKWMGMGKFNSDDLYIYYYGQESLRRNGVALIVNKRFQNAVLGCNLKTTE